jgi:hypothetical protein
MASRTTAATSTLLRAVDAGVEAWLPKCIARVSAADMTAADFESRFLQRSLPVVIEGAARHWSALDKWSPEYLSASYGDAAVTVNVTPEGWGDAPVALMSATQKHGDKAPLPPAVFVAPLEVTARLGDVMRALNQLAPSRNAGGPPSECFPRDGDADDASQPPSIACATCALHSGVPYLSFQNDNLRSQLPALMRDIGDLPCIGLECGSEASSACMESPVLRSLGAAEAVNLWIGDSRSVSWAHKDHYENIFVVVRGSKRFLLLPPMALPGLYEREYECWRYALEGPCTCSEQTLGPHASTTQWVARPEVQAGAAGTAPSRSRVPWISVNFESPDLDAFPAFASVQVREHRLRTVVGHIMSPRGTCFILCAASFLHADSLLHVRSTCG